MSEDPELAAARRFVDDLDARALREEADQPHSVIAYDPMTRSYTVTGPYPDALTATVAADHIQRELNEAAGAPGYPPIRTWVALHFAPEDHQ